MESYEIKTCRLCNKEGYVFCDIYHESITKISKLIPSLLNLEDDNLQHIKKVCTNCYQTVKTICYNIECIIDTQKILRIENAIRPKISTIQIEDITRKYTDIKIKRVSADSKIAIKSEDAQPSNDKIVVIEALPPTEQVQTAENESPKKNRCLMCISCSRKFTDFGKMQLHLQACQSSLSGDLKCFCGKRMNSRRNLELHVYTQHKEHKRKHVCTMCQKVFTSMFNLQNHIASHKTANRELSKGAKHYRDEIKLRGNETVTET